MRFGFASWLALGVLREQAGGAPGGGGGGGAPPPAPAPPAQPFAVFESQAAFEERMSRAQRSFVREQYGVEDPNEVKTRLARLKELEDQEAARKREEMTATQRLEQDLANEKAARLAAEAARDGERFRATVSGECARLGIKNLKYAQFIVAEAAEALPDGQQLDPYAYLKDLVEKPEYKGAFGIEVAAPAVQPAPVNTSPQPGTPPPPPPAPGTPPATVDAMNMNPTQFREHLASLGAGGLSV